MKIKCGKSKGMQEKLSIMGVSSASLVMPISDPRDRFFYPHHTPMKATYNLYCAYPSFLEYEPSNALKLGFHLT